ncbi:hypothetical protein [Arthrobacter oryzae]|uniref:hypothetical protein n=1 Tax=Arthrobacter oryzae TaxID=409290 RepID=UPI00277E47A3|nr:hypothetical protein [Arthrobacter oryzae]MDQ0079517.1 hypothetical protein [Arthrobacter oryzae]
MESEVAALISLNLLIGEKESNGEGAYLRDEVLAPSFAMRRAKEGKVVDKDTFLEGVKQSPQRSTRVVSVAFFGENRATVSCVVTFEGRYYDNFRLFVRESSGLPWKLLAWANEELTSDWPGA